MSKRLLFLAIAALVFGLVLIYPSLRLLDWAGVSVRHPIGLASCLFILPFLTRVATESIHRQWARSLAAVVMTWLGVSFCALCLLLPAEILLFVTSAIGLAPEKTVLAEYLAYTVLICTVGLGLYGIYNARRLHVRRVPIDLSSTSPALSPSSTATASGIRIAQISDIHIGSRNPKILRKIVAKLNTEAPDYVVITGDLVDMHGITSEDLAPLARIEAPSYFCIGNHERYVDVDDICARLAAHGITVLRNATALTPAIQFLGIDDAERRDQVAQQLEHLEASPKHYKVLLYHRPDGAEAAASWGADLMLTGHTHRGQIFPFNFLVARVFPRLYRSYDVDGLHLYVSPGTGTWGPVMRLGSKCEITLFKLG